MLKPLLSKRLRVSLHENNNFFPFKNKILIFYYSCVILYPIHPEILQKIKASDT